MKHYFLGIMAIALAIGFSAFTSQKKTNNIQRLPQIPMLWYEVDALGVDLVDYHNSINSVPETRDYFLSTQGFCNEGDTKDCVRGYDNVLHVPTSSTDRNEDEIIQRD